MIVAMGQMGNEENNLQGPLLEQLSTISLTTSSQWQSCSPWTSFLATSMELTGVVVENSEPKEGEESGRVPWHSWYRTVLNHYNEVALVHLILNIAREL